MNFQDIILKTRSTRRFNQNKKTETNVLKKLVDYARLSASSSNLQNLKFFLSNEGIKNEKILVTLKWAYYLKDWSEPREGEKPSAFIVVLADTEIHPTIEVDVGIAVQSIRLGATTLGLSSCPVGSIDRQALRKLLRIPEKYDIPIVIAIGEAKEEVVIEKMQKPDNAKYWRDNNGIHHVPKRDLDDIIIEEFKESYKKKKSSIVAAAKSILPF